MILKQIAHYLRELYKHSAYQSNLEEQNNKLLRDIHSRVCLSEGHVTVAGKVDLKPEQLKQLESYTSHKAEELTLNFKFTQALFMSLNAESDEKVCKILDEAKVEHLSNTLEAYKAVADLTEDVERMRQDMITRYEDRKDDFSVDVRAMIERMIREGKAELDAEAARMKALREKINSGLDQLARAVKNAEASCAEAKNVLTANAPASRRTKRIKAS